MGKEDFNIQSDVNGNGKILNKQYLLLCWLEYKMTIELTVAND